MALNLKLPYILKTSKMDCRVIIIDDEPLLRERLKNLISEYPFLRVVAECENGKTALTEISRHQPNVIFIDIQMPLIDGFRVLDHIDYSDLLVIFITAYDQYAVKAFEYKAFDYLLKPITRARFKQTILRIKNSFEDKSIGQKNNQIFVKSGRTINKVDVRNITHIEASNNHIKVHTFEKTYKSRTTLSNFIKENHIPELSRVHRSYVANFLNVEGITQISKGEYFIKLKNGRIIPTSKKYSAAVEDYFINENY